MSEQALRYLVLPSAGSAGLAWSAAGELLGGTVHPLPDAASVAELAEAVGPLVAALPRPRVLVGSSLGGMVSLEVASRVDVDGLVIFAAGYGVEVADSTLDWVAANPPDLLPKMAKVGLSRGAAEELVRVRLDDFTACGSEVVLHHLTALRDYHPAQVTPKVPTIVVWGENDRSVPQAAHVELALRLGGVLVPLAGVGHSAFLEDPERSVAAIRLIERLL